MDHAAIKNEICSRIENGETLRSICREQGKPHFTTVYDWMKADEDFALRFACAREAGHDAIAEECLVIADESGAEISIDEKTGGLKVDGEVIQRAKLRIETRLKLLAKWNPRYAESLKHTGDPAQPVSLKHEMKVTFVSNRNTDTGSI